MKLPNEQYLQTGECPSSVNLRRGYLEPNPENLFCPGALCNRRLTANATLPAWLNGPGFRAVIHSDDETTLVCLEDRVPQGVEADTGWACLRTIGPFPFDASGIVRALIDPISANGIGVFVVCTFDGEHVLIPSPEVENATRFLEAAGHVVESR